MADRLFAPTKLGSIALKNRIVMAPLTRSRAIGNVPNALMAKYYEQRSEAGLIITEGTAPSPDGLGYARIPGCFSRAQAEAWKTVTTGVHAQGARIFLQLMHTGRVGHPRNLPQGARVLAPSAVAAPGKMYTDQEGMQDHPVPTAMTEADVQKAIAGYADAAGLAVDVGGFDGVELHGANGYLIDQFLNTASNQRTDVWGGSIEGRQRFAVEVARAVAKRIGASRVGIRISPYGVFGGMTPDAAMEELYVSLAKALRGVGIAYMHIVDHSSMGAPALPPDIKAKIHAAFGGNVILSGGYDKARAEADLAAEKGELVAFGRPFISNPRLVSALKAGKPLVQPDPATFYTPGEKGYTDYPV